uniref:hypothetical protein n=1 Tax=Porodaedalea mongolica TaxID=2651638 RepID=UPI0021AD0230|nr:hypothetical protein NYK79_mgp12 [Porodaedalea mongolica]UUA03978.1 hypothetical protein [Porodaedalea mongolica]WCF76747.1 hypothetical protein [Porodaedalea mongolica]
MSKQFKDMLIGVLLGDAHIRRVGSSKAYITFEQSKAKAEYLNYLHELNQEENLALDIPKLYQRIDPRYNNKLNESLQFRTKTSEDLKPFADLFLASEGNKQIPSDIVEHLTPRSLAFWIMDDGQQVKKGGVTLCTDSFKGDEISLLQGALKTNFNFSTTIHLKKGANGASYERIYIKKGDLEGVKPSLVDHMHDSMLYKINVEPVNVAEVVESSLTASTSLVEADISGLSNVLSNTNIGDF